MTFCEAANSVSFELTVVDDLSGELLEVLHLACRHRAGPEHAEVRPEHGGGARAQRVQGFPQNLRTIRAETRSNLHT